MPFIEQLGQQAIGSVLGIGLAGWNDARQVHQQGELNQLEREQMDYAMKKQYEMWEKTGYVGQMAQMKKAGINPALMYGMGGGGGQSTGAPGSAHTAATGHSGEAMGIGLAAANMGLLKAQKENIEADTRNKEAGTGKVTAETTTEKERPANIKADTGLKQTELAYNRDTYNTRMEGLSREIELIYSKAREIDQNIGITADQRQSMVALKASEAANAVKQGLLLTASKLKTEQETEQSKAQVKQIEEVIKTIPEYLKLAQSENRADIEQKTRMAEYLKGQTRTLPVEVGDAVRLLGEILQGRNNGTIGNPFKGIGSKPPF